MRSIGKSAAVTIIFLIAALSVFGLLGCGEEYGTSAGDGGTVTATGGGTVEVKLKDTSFRPADLTVDKGTTVRWTNEDSINHTVTANDQKFDSGILSGGETFEFTFNETGAFDYHCTIHPSQMRGKITVK
jgi:plastocyanin